jgi:hypothetical protein
VKRTKALQQSIKKEVADAPLATVPSTQLACQPQHFKPIIMQPPASHHPHRVSDSEISDPDDEHDYEDGDGDDSIGKRQRKERFDSKEDRDALLSGNGTRFDCSLGILTRKFVNLAKKSAGQIVDLKDAANQLQVAKRRIYDITNVLEGINMIEKSHKNKVKWKGSPSINSDLQAEGAPGTPGALFQTCFISHSCHLSFFTRPSPGSQPTDNSEIIKRKIIDEEQRIRQHCESIQGMRQRLAEMQQRQEFSEWGFVSDHEIRGVRELKDKILLRLNAPKGSILHVPNNVGQFELFLSVPPDLKVTTWLNLLIVYMEVQMFFLMLPSLTFWLQPDLASGSSRIDLHLLDNVHEKPVPAASKDFLANGCLSHHSALQDYASSDGEQDGESRQVDLCLTLGHLYADSSNDSTMSSSAK